MQGHILCKFYKGSFSIFSMVGDVGKETNKQGFVSEYSMGQYDFSRYNDWLKFIEKYSGEINSMAIPTLSQCQNYFSGINVLYKLWKPLISRKEIKEAYTKKIEKAKKLKRKWERSMVGGGMMSNTKILELVDILDDLHTELMATKQVIGLGIVVKRLYDSKEKIKSGMQKKVHGDLPEK